MTAKKTVLKWMHYYQVQHGHAMVSEAQLLSHLSLSYQQLHAVADELKKDGLLKSYIARGGTAEYQLTDEALFSLALSTRRNNRNKRFILGAVLLVILFVIVFFSF